MRSIQAQAAEWESLECMEGDANPEKPWITVPRVWGVLVKAKE